jgi:uncharacterized membrane protein YebE (DUF533 family)
MKQAKSLLDSLLGGVSDLTGGKGVQGLATQARGAWDGQSTAAKGAIAGGLLGVLLSGHAGRLIGTGVKVGGAALIGGLAYKAYTDWQQGNSAKGDRPVALSKSEDAFEVDDDFAERLLQAMVAAAKADGHVTPAERLSIDRKLARLGLEAEAQALIAAELDSPLDVGRIAGLARNEVEAVEIYAASLLVVDAAGPAEKGYLAMLAARLGLEPALVAHVHARAGVRAA